MNFWDFETLILQIDFLATLTTTQLAALKTIGPTSFSSLGKSRAKKFGAMLLNRAFSKEKNRGRFQSLFRKIFSQTTSVFVEEG